MSVLNLDFLFQPRSVVLIGASIKPRTVGNVVMQNLLKAGFKGPIFPVNPKYGAVEGIQAYRRVSSLPEAPDLAVICTPARTVPSLITELGEAGTRAAVVLSAGFRETQGTPPLEAQLLHAAKPYGLRILGPNCIGLLIPGIGLNASFAHIGALPGRLALVSQSGALCTTFLDWARSNGVGFSHFISLGDGLDVDFADVLDYLGHEPATQGILLYIESVKLARKFMSAARAVSRNKPVLAIKAGRFSEGARAAASHTGALAGRDDVFDTALRRAGLLRVYELEELFDAAETLARSRPISGDRVVILTNGGGPGVLATDALIAAGGRLAELSPVTLERLSEHLPPMWSRGNPVDIIGDADSNRYVEALKILADDLNTDVILVMHVPTAIISSEEVARAVVAEIQGIKRPVLVSWMGTEAVAKARAIFRELGIPSYDTPYKAVRGLLHSVNYRRNQELLMETPPSLPEQFEPDLAAARRVIEETLDAGLETLTEPEAKAVLAAFGIPVVETRTVREVDAAVAAAEAIGYPVALKLLSPDITHKSDVGGVVLDLDDPQVLRAAAKGMLSRLASQKPKARVLGFTVQKMARWPGAHELIIGAATDPIFGPVCLFGQGGIAVEIIDDKAVALPPLNLKLARELMARTRIFKLLQGYRDRSPADLGAIELVLVKISQLITDVPEIVELDINPLLADARGVIALDARMRVARTRQKGASRLAIRPYPKELEETALLDTGRKVLLRPIRPEDEPAHLAFLNRLEPEDLYFRFFTAVYKFDHARLARFTQIDYDREMAFIATAPDEHGMPETLGVVRAVCGADNITAELAVVVRSDIKGQGLGRLLLEKLIGYCRERGTRRIVGEALPQNVLMRRLAKRAGFREEFRANEGTVSLILELQ